MAVSRTVTKRLQCKKWLFEMSLFSRTGSQVSRTSSRIDPPLAAKWKKEKRKKRKRKETASHGVMDDGRQPPGQNQLPQWDKLITDPLADVLIKGLAGR